MKKKGFTLVEVLIAVTVLVTGITAPVVIAYNSIQASNLSRDQISAYYFAQEGIEYIRYIRDTNIVSGRAWLSFTGLCSNGSPCDIISPARVVDANGDLSNCGGGTCSPIRYHSGNNIFTSNSGNNTVFTRGITITDRGDEADVVVVVSWTTNGRTWSYTLEETMFDWSGT